MTTKKDVLFGTIAVELGYITARQLSECLGLQKEKEQQGTYIPLGNLLIKKNYIDHSQRIIIEQQCPDQNSQKTGLVRYQIQEEIGRGGMGQVYKAYDSHLKRQVALKFIAPGEDIERFFREAKAIAKLTHPGIIRIYELGHEQNQNFFAMELVEGKSLAQILQKSHLGIKQAVSFMIKIATAVQFAHNKGIIHRDLKPANIMIDSENKPRVMDFGLAKSLEDQKRLSQSGEVLGTIFYMSPEQANHTDKVDTLSDIYSLGAMFYEMLTGRPPFTGSFFSVLEQILEKEPAPLSQIRNDIPQALEKICLKALNKKKKDRYPNAKAMVVDFETFSQGNKITTAKKRSRKTGKKKKSSPLNVVNAGITVLLLLIFLWPKNVDKPKDTVSKSSKLHLKSTKLVSKSSKALKSPKHISKSSKTLKSPKGISKSSKSHLKSVKRVSKSSKALKSAKPKSKKSQSKQSSKSLQQQKKQAYSAEDIKWIKWAEGNLKKLPQRLKSRNFGRIKHRLKQFEQRLRALKPSPPVLLQVNQKIADLETIASLHPIIFKSLRVRTKLSVTLCDGKTYRGRVQRVLRARCILENAQGQSNEIRFSHIEARHMQKIIDPTYIDNKSLYALAVLAKYDGDLAFATKTLKKAKKYSPAQKLLLELSKKVGPQAPMKRMLETHKQAPIFRGNTVHSGFYGRFSLEKLTGPKWIFSSQKKISSSPTVFDKTVYFGSEDTFFYSVDLTGKLRWKFKTQGKIESSAAIVENIVYFGSHDKYLYALNTDGSLKWKLKIGNTIVASPLVNQKYIYLGSLHGHVWCIERKNKKIIWRYKTKGHIYASPVFANGSVLVGSMDNHFYALNQHSGALRWKLKTQGKITSSATAMNGVVYFGSYDSLLYALNSSTGKLLWTFKTKGPIRSSPGIYQGIVYVGSHDRYLYAIDSYTQKLKWKFLAKAKIRSSAAITRTTVYFGCDDQYIYAIDIKNGQLRWKFKTNGSIVSSPALEKGLLYIGSYDGKLYCLH